MYPASTVVLARVVLGERATWRSQRRELVVGPAGGESAFDAVVVNADPLTVQPRPSAELSLSGYVLFLEADGTVGTTQKLSETAGGLGAFSQTLFGLGPPRDVDPHSSDRDDLACFVTQRVLR